MEGMMETRTQVEIARETLFGVSGLRANDVKLFPGTDRDTTPEQMAEQVNNAIAQVLAGDFDVISDEE